MRRDTYRPVADNTGGKRHLTPAAAFLTRPSEPMRTRATGQQARARVARRGRSPSGYTIVRGRGWSTSTDCCTRRDRRRFSDPPVCVLASDHQRPGVRGRSNLSIESHRFRLILYNKICRANDKSANIPVQAHWTARCLLACVECDRQMATSDVNECF